MFKIPQLPELPKHQIYQESKSNFSFDILVDENGIAEYII